ncbi:MAG: hypothetical protein ACM3UL_04290 [Ignavibacteria bacterium]
MTEEKLDFSRRLLIWGNLALLGWVFLAFLGVLFYSFLYSWLYLIFLAFMIYAILRRLGCSSCYKCRTCTSGFGRLAGAFFGKKYVKHESVDNRIGLVAFVYVLLFVVPTVLLSVSLLNSISYPKVMVLVFLLVVTVYSFTTWSKRSAASLKS